MKLSIIKGNPNNPRIIKDDKFKKLVKSINEFPKMLELRPIIVDENFIVQGGNMRLKALQELKYKDVPESWIKQVSDLTEEQKKEFIIKDNVGFGEWDFDDLANNWDVEKLNDWGLDIPQFAKDIDYCILDEDDVLSQLTDMAGNVKKAIQIEFEIDHYDEAFKLVKFWREQQLYVGGFLVEKLKEEKLKI